MKSSKQSSTGLKAVEGLTAYFSLKVTVTNVAYMIKQALLEFKGLTVMWVRVSTKGETARSQSYCDQPTLLRRPAPTSVSGQPRGVVQQAAGFLEAKTKRPWLVNGDKHQQRSGQRQILRKLDYLQR